MKISVWDYLDEYEDEREELLAAVDRVFRSGRLILGESVASFERAFAEYCGVAHGVGVDNGTNAIFLSLKALGIGGGDEVITVANTAVPTVSAIVATGAVARFVDIDRATFLMDVERLEAAITSRTRCILPVHLYGQCVPMAEVRAVADAHGLDVIEDCAQCHGATQGGEKAGSMGRLGAFSFYPTKPLGAYGDGGMVVTDEETLAEKLRSLRFYGMKHRYYSEEPGYNSRLDELQAELLLVKLNRLERYIERRRDIAQRYRDLLHTSSVQLPVELPENRHVYYLYVVRHPDRDRIISEMARREIHLNISYPWPIHTMRGFRELGYREGDLPDTELAAREVFSLPMYPTLSEEAQNQVCEQLRQILGE